MPKATPDRGADGNIRPELKAVKQRFCGGRKANRGPEAPTCKQPAGYGTDHPGWGHCAWHFGQSPSGKQYAEKVRTEAHAWRAALDLGISVDTTPERALADEINRSAGLVAWIQDQIQHAWPTDDDGLVEVEYFDALGVPRKAKVTPLAALTSHPATRAVMEAYRDERAHLARVAKMGVDANLVDRQLKLDGQRVDLMSGLIAAIITDLGHDPNDNQVRAVVSRRLLAITAS